MRRELIAALLLALLGAALGETRVMVVTDIHYMAPSLYAGSGLFLRALRAGDGKYTQQSDALMEALCAAVRAESPVSMTTLSKPAECRSSTACPASGRRGSEMRITAERIPLMAR